MKKTSRLCLLGGLLLLGGCASQYVITLNNGAQITTSGKPARSNGAWIYKDASGKEQSVPEGRVHEVAPASMMEKPTPTKAQTPHKKRHWYYLWLA